MTIGEQPVDKENSKLVILSAFAGALGGAAVGEVFNYLAPASNLLTRISLDGALASGGAFAGTVGLTILEYFKQTPKTND